MNTLVSRKLIIFFDKLHAVKIYFNEIGYIEFLALTNTIFSIM